ncbi:MAG: imidazole glycerol phosphate synthase subunit HisH [Acidimicrobiales bacterium]
MTAAPATGAWQAAPPASPPGPPLAVLDYGIGNLRSAERALRAVGADATLVTEPGQARGAAGVVLPGVGAFGRAAQALRDTGLDAVALDALDRGLPFLGICVGLQLLYVSSEEDPGVRGLGIFDAAVVRLPGGTKLPQMQWNVLDAVPGRASRLLGEGGVGTWVYFVHSYAPQLGPETVATCDYGGTVVAAVESGALWGTQFHPEKSGAAGLSLLRRFVESCG